MYRHSLLYTLLSIILMFFLPAVQADDFDKALQAYAKSDYVQAIKLFTPLAEQGDSRAQYNLWLAYSKNGATKLSRQYLIQSRSSGLIDSYFIMTSDTTIAARNPEQTWLFSQPEESYTLQLATGKTTDYLQKMKQKLIKGKKLAQAHNLSILKVKFVDKAHNNTPSSRYILVYGVFDSYPKAKEEITRLPESLQKSKPWIRQLKVLQSIMSKDQVKK